MKYTVLLGTTLALLCAGATELPDIITQFAYRDDLQNIKHPVLPGWCSRSVEPLRRQTADVMALSEADLLSLLPVRNGIFFAGCPVPGCRNPQGSRFGWSLADPGHLTCLTCTTVFPHPDYPEHGATTVVAPSGKTLNFPYVLGADGRKYYIQAAIDARKVHFFSTQAFALAQLYLQTNDVAAGRRGALIICALARAFPDFVYKYDYPFTDIEWVDGQPTPAQLRPHFRTSRLDWWAYMDMPMSLILAYDFLQHNNLLTQIAAEQQLDVQKDIVQGFYRTACEGILANQDHLTNMSPSMWRNLVLAARVFNAPDYFHVSLKRFLEFQRRFFLYDGFWMEPSTGYHRQSTGGLKVVQQAMQDYSDPEGPLSPYADTRLSHVEAQTFVPMLQAAEWRVQQLIYPDGRSLPINDSWAKEKAQSLDTTRPSYLVPALGLAMLSGGQGPDQTQLGLAFTLKTGHNHHDLLNLMFYANRREMISEAGYTHTHLRGYASSSPAHNLVVVDGKNQNLSAINGPVEFVECDHPEIAIAAADGQRAYTGLNEFRRAVFLIRIDDENFYAADFFAVDGETQTCDYFLHGDRWHEDTETVWAGTKKMDGNPDDLLPAPERTAWTPATGATVWEDIRQPFKSYGYFQQIKRFDFTAGVTPRITWNDDLTLWLLPPPGQHSALFTGRAPAIAPADEDPQKIQQLMNRFLCLRINRPQGRVVFSSVLAPVPTKSAVDTVVDVRRPGDGILHVRFASGREDVIWWQQTTPIRLTLNKQPITPVGLYGFLSLNSDGTQRASYQIQDKVTIAVRSADGRTNLTFTPDPRLPASEHLADFIRIIHPQTQTAFGNATKSLNPGTGQLETREPLGFSMDASGTFKHTGFPLTELPPGTVIEFFVRENKFR